MRRTRVSDMGAILNLNGTPHYIHLGFFQMSVANFVVIIVMLVVFALAIYLRAPGAKSPGRHK
jgi:hypothetical protein